MINPGCIASAYAAFLVWPRAAICIWVLRCCTQFTWPNLDYYYYYFVLEWYTPSTTSTTSTAGLATTNQPTSTSPGFIELPRHRMLCNRFSNDKLNKKCPELLSFTLRFWWLYAPKKRLHYGVQIPTNSSGSTYRIIYPCPHLYTIHSTLLFS